MKTTTSPLSAPFILRTVGCILVLASLADYVALFSPPFEFSNKTKLVMGLTQFVDRGAFALVGMALYYISSTFETLAGLPNSAKPLVSLRFWIMLLSTLLGILFFVSVPLQFTNMTKVADDSVKTMSDKFAKDEEGITSQVEERQAKLAELIKDKAKFDLYLQQVTAAINSPDLPKDQKAGAEKVKKDLQELQADPSKLPAKAQESKNDALNQIRAEKQSKENEIRGEASKVSLRSGFLGMLLAGGYTLIGWLGLAEMGTFSKGSRKAS
jgi:hypothetical protein